jgi:hypothetical protein
MLLPRVFEELPNKVQLASTHQCFASDDQEVRMRDLLLSLHLQAKSARPRAYSPRRKAVPLLNLPQDLSPNLTAEIAPPHPQGKGGTALDSDTTVAAAG